MSELRSVKLNFIPEECSIPVAPQADVASVDAPISDVADKVLGLADLQLGEIPYTREFANRMAALMVRVWEYTRNDPQLTRGVLEELTVLLNTALIPVSILYYHVEKVLAEACQETFDLDGQYKFSFMEEGATDGDDAGDAPTEDPGDPTDVASGSGQPGEAATPVS